MATKENFTAGRVAGYQCEPGKAQTFYRDAKTPGLALRVTAAGAKSYIFETKLDGRNVRVTIGDVKTWAVGDAQDEATRLKAMTNQGIDPRQVVKDRRTEQKAAAMESRRQDITLGAVWQAYIKERSCLWSAWHIRDHERVAHVGGIPKVRGKGLTEPGPLASLLLVKLSELTGDRIAAWLAKEKAQRPTQAALAYRLLSVFVNWCESQVELAGLVPSGACKAKKVKETLPKKNAKEGDCLQREQLPLWFDAVRKLNNPVHSAYLQALLLTGARRRELVGLRWQDVDFQWGSMTIRDKVEGERTIPLTPYLASLLLDLKRRKDTPPPEYRILHGKRIKNDLENWQPPEWVFSSPTAANGQLSEPTAAHGRALEAAGLPHVTLHGLRRSFGTLCEWVEVPAGVVAQIQGHKPSAIAEKHYRRRPLDLLRMWHSKIEAWILQEAGIQFDPEQAKPGLRIASAS